LAVGDVLVLNGVGHGMLRNSAVRSAFKFSTFSLCLEHLFPLFAGRDVAMLGTVTERFRVPKHYPGDSSVAMACHGFLEDLPPRFDIDHRSQLLRAAAAVLALELKNARTRHTGYVRIEEHISNVLETLSVTDIQHGTVHELARKFSCTPRHLNRLFHRHFGYSVAAFKMELRLLKAASLLCDPSAKVIRVAEECGFNFLGQFNTCFKRRFKLSPGEWRKGKAGLPPPHAKTVDGDGSCRMMALGLCPWIGKGITDTRSLSCR
jgi:AraC-like DNA-binding protein